MKKVFILMVVALVAQVSYCQNYYFPPNTGSQWGTVSPKTLGWNEDKLDSVYKFLDDRNSKAFIILKGGEIAAEKYFDDFTKDSAWYWASAGKSLCATLIGIAQQEGSLNIKDKTSKYLGNGWTSLTQVQEDSITLFHQLTMSSGLDDLLKPTPQEPDPSNCLKPECLQYKANAGKRWAYHNAPYRLLQDIIDSATGLNINQYTNQKLRNTIGMQGLWINYVYYSRPRDMARFGSLILNKGKWGNTSILNYTGYYNAMVNSSQSINPAYGYLWWLNGKSSFKTPLLQTSFNGYLVPNAPADMYAGMGKNEQRVYIIPSMDMVVIRMGDPTGAPALAIADFDNDFWGLLQQVFYSNVSVTTAIDASNIKIYPNPVADFLTIETNEHVTVEIFSVDGKRVLNSSTKNAENINVSALNKGVYALKLSTRNTVFTSKFIKQ